MKVVQADGERRIKLVGNRLVALHLAATLALSLKKCVCSHVSVVNLFTDESESYTYGVDRNKWCMLLSKQKS